MMMISVRLQLRVGIEVSLVNSLLSLGGHVESPENKKLYFLQGQPCTEFASGGGLPRKNKAFHSPETQHGLRVIRVN